MAYANRFRCYLALLLLLSVTASAQVLDFEDGFEGERNQPPVIISGPVTTGQVDELYSYDVDAMDPNGDFLVYLLTTSPVGMVINSTTGRIVWTPDAEGDYPVEVEVSDGHGLNDTQAWMISVESAVDMDMDGLSDVKEYLYGTDPADDDSDDDGLLDGEEVFTYDTDPLHPDSDRDGLDDGEEVDFYGTEPFNADTDGDGFGDGLEVAAGTDPLNPGDFPDGPPDPQASAPPNDATVATTLFESIEFLWNEAPPIQTGVMEGTIEPVRAAVVRGRVMDRNGAPLPGVVISIHDHPEFGQTLSRVDGMFDMAVNGGGPLIVNFDAMGYLPAQRHITVPWQEYVRLTDVVMVLLDTELSVIALGGPDLEVARGSMETDSDGSRQATVMFPAGTTAELVMPDGTTQPINTLDVRATEYTVGDNGPQAMPAGLPPSSGYTYAVDFSVDQAITAGASEVRFDQPLPTYVENFLDFPVGGVVPAGFYDRQQGAWVPSLNGLVVEIVAEVGGLAELDLDGDGVAEDAAALAALGVTDAERESLATLYDPGQELWRVPVTHFSPWDYNWPYGPGPNDTPPNGPSPRGGGGGGGPDDDCRGPGGSIIGCENQTVSESLPVTGAPFTLNYISDRVPGRMATNSIEIPLSGDQIEATLTRIDLEVRVAGRTFEESFAPAPNLIHVFEWDGLDAYGRIVRGTQPATVRVGFVYGAVYLQPSAFGSAFGRFSGSSGGSGVGGSIIANNQARQEIIFWQTWAIFLGPWDARGLLGLGAWTPSVHHVYDPVSRVLNRGDGRRRSASQFTAVQQIGTAAGIGEDGFSGDGGPATEAQLFDPIGLAASPDGGLYIADWGNDRVRRIDPDGIITTFAGNGVDGFSGDGGPATDAQLSNPAEVEVHPDGSVYIADFFNDRIRRVDPEGIITTVAGNGIGGFSGDGGPATDAQLNLPRDIAVHPDGSVYIADAGNNRIRRVGPDGIITTVAGDGIPCLYAPIPNPCGDGGTAVAAQIGDPLGLAVGSDGSLYIADSEAERIRRVDPAGIITTAAGGGQDFGDGIPATTARLTGVRDVAFGPDGSLYIVEDDRVHRVGPDGVINTEAGVLNEFGFAGEGGPASAAQLNQAISAVVLPDGTVFITDRGNARIRNVEAPLPGYSASDITIVSEDGSELYDFDFQGRHLRTLHALTGATLYTFGYDSEGRLTTIEDGDENLTTIQRDGAGNPTAIQAPFGQITELDLDANGYLARVTNPAGETYNFTYFGDLGLLASSTDRLGNMSQMTYDDMGRLILDEGPAGGFAMLQRTELEEGYEVVLTKAEGLSTTYRVEVLETGEVRRTRIDPSGAETVLVIGTDGSRTLTNPDGTEATLSLGPDPRWGMLAPLAASQSMSTPEGLSATLTMERMVELADPTDPLSVITQTDTVTFNGQTYNNTFDASLGQYTRQTPAGRELVTTIDELGRVRSVQLDPAIDPQTYDYDAQGRLTEIAQGPQHWTYTYDGLGRPITRTDAGANELQIAYDGADRVTQVTAATGRTYQYTYDANGNVVQVIMPSDSAHVLEYNALNLLSGYIAPDNAPLTRSYDLDQRWTNTMLPSGRNVDSDYDPAGRPMGLTYPEATTTYSFDDETDRVSQLTRNPTGVGGTQMIDFDYDGSLVTETTWSGEAEGTFTDTYDNSFFLVEQELVSGVDMANVVFTRDLDGALTGVGPFVVTRNGPFGFTSGISDGSLDVTYTYDALGRLASRSHAVPGQDAYEVTLIYDNVGRIEQKIETAAGIAHTYDYTYDDDGRLTEVQQDAMVVETYGYDANGNRTSTESSTASYDDQDRLTELGGVAYTFDADGFLSQRGSDTFSYSARGELISATVSAQMITYSYDGLGRRVARSDDSGTQEYLYGNPGNVFQITATRDTLGILTTYYYDEAGTLFALFRDGAWYYVASDQVGSPRVVTDDTGTVLKVVEYDTFGVRIADSNPGFELAVGYAGGLEDPDTGLVRFGFRDYEAAAGRWMARDPLLFDGGQTNLYVYVDSNPASLVDPSGLFCVGGSAYAGFGAGFKACVDEEGVSGCAEVGLGVGGGVDVDPLSGIDGNSDVVGAGGKVSAAGVSVGLEGKLDDCGRLTGGPNCGLFGVSCSGKVGFGDPSAIEIVAKGAKVKAEAKVYAESCRNAKW